MRRTKSREAWREVPHEDQEQIVTNLPMRRTKSTNVLEAMKPMTKAKQMMIELAMVRT